MGLKDTIRRSILVGAALLSTGFSNMEKPQDNNNEQNKQEAIHQNRAQKSKLKAEYPSIPLEGIAQGTSYDLFDADGHKVQNRTLLKKEHFEIKTQTVNTMASELEKTKQLSPDKRDQAVLDTLKNYKPTETTEVIDTPNKWQVSLYDNDQKLGGSYTLEDTDVLCRDASEGSVAAKVGYLREYSLPDKNGKMQTYKPTGDFRLQKHLSIKQLKYLDARLDQLGKRVQINKVSTDILSKAAAQAR